MYTAFDLSDKNTFFSAWDMYTLYFIATVLNKENTMGIKYIMGK